MIETIISEVAKNKIAGILNDILSKLGDEIAQFANNNILEYLVQEYRNCKQTKTILHRDHPVDIDRIYQPLFLHRSYDMFQKPNNTRALIETTNIKDVFQNSNLITIIGDAGSGKSTIIKYLFLNAIRSDYKIPIKVELRYLNGTDKGVEDYIIDNIIKYENIATSNQIIKRMLTSGRFVIFLDGYDELDSSIKSRIAREISQLAKKYYDNSYIITSRPTDEIDLLEGFHNYRVCKLTKEQIENFVKRQYEDEAQEIANKIIVSINSKEVEQYRHFLKNPLLLSMFIFTYQTDSHIPQKTSDFYAQVFNTLYSGHDTISKLGYSREKRSGLSKDNILSILEKFSFISYWNSKYTFQYAEMQDYLKKVKVGIKIEFEDDALIHDLYVAINILTKDGIIYEFPHRSIQEYFAASFVAGAPKEIKDTLYRLFTDADLLILPSNLNFFFLLKELDNDNFNRLFLIPYIDQINNVINRGIKRDAYVYFNVLCLISKLFSKNMYKDFIKIDAEYDKQLRSHSHNKIKIKELKKIKEKLTKELITPFMSNYNYTAIADEIKESISEENELGKKFINEIFNIGI